MKKILMLIAGLLISVGIWAETRPTVSTTEVNVPVGPYGFSNFNWDAFEFTTIASSNMATGDLDLYTVPAGYRGMFQTAVIGGSTNGSNVSYYMEVKTNSTYYRLTSTATVAAGAIATITSTWVYDAGETLAININNAGANLYVNWVQWPTNVSIQSAKLFSLAAGSNTIYTASSGSYPLGLSQVGAGTTTANYVNDSGGARTVSWFLLTPGGVTNQFSTFRTQSPADDSLTTLTVPPLGLLDSVVIQVDANTATQLAWFTYYNR